jgi:hypothetical protein
VQVERFPEVVAQTVRVLRSGVDRDWSVAAGPLSWSCRETAGHIVDVVFAYALQLAAEAHDHYLPFAPLDPLPEAAPEDLVDGIGAVGKMFTAVMATTAEGLRAWHPFGMLSTTEWAGLGANEVIVHTFDITSGLNLRFEPAAALCDEVLHDMLRLHDRRDASALSGDPCVALLELSGRPRR